MNLNDGREVFNSEAVATNVNYAEIDDEIHEAMKRGAMYRDFEQHKRDEFCNLLNKEA